MVSLDDQFNPPANFGTGLVLQNATAGVLGSPALGTSRTGAESFWHSSRDIMWQRESHWTPYTQWNDVAGTIQRNYPFAVGVNAVQVDSEYPARRVSAEDEIEVMTKRRLGSHETIAYTVTIGASVLGLDMSLNGIGVGEAEVIAVGIGYLKCLLKHN